ncbi:MYXO-CTERM domain-containing protein [Bryocella elongata]|uniref:MYXO-CTERM domain-containing protein n=1 Tax=Bryocella elongata TaxID=863522 RepID=A0A1H5YPL4_9BACT|nr:hypothetical protein [Bryocella elongata]SEG26049.1 MYXO-CTERM domain-containing protein [Bryocella elongata]
MKFVSTAVLCRAAVTAALVLPTVAMAAPGSWKVEYASGGQVVVHDASTGLDYEYTLGVGDKVTTAAGAVTVSGLKPGTVITDGLTGTARMVQDISVVKGTVVSVSPPFHLIVKVNGDIMDTTVSEAALDKVNTGDTVDLTLITVRTPGDPRTPNPVKALPMVGKLAVFQQPVMEEPDSATNLPTYGVAGVLLLAVGLGLRARRRSVQAGS